MKKTVTFILLSLVFMNYRSPEIEQKNPIMLYRVIGNGQPLVLVPGGLTGWASWDPFVPEFSNKKKVIQVQLLNVQYGLEGTALPQNYSVRTESEALAAVLSSAGMNEKAD